MVPRRKIDKASGARAGLKKAPPHSKNILWRMLFIMIVYRWKDKIRD